MSNKKKLATLFAQAHITDDIESNAVVPAIQPSTTFLRHPDNTLISPKHMYARDDNDLTRLAEAMLAEAEQAEQGLLFPSGMAAIAALVRTVPNGGRIIMQSGIYWGTTKWTRTFCQRRDIDLIEVDCSDIDALEAISQTLQTNGEHTKQHTPPRYADLIWVELPSNPYIKTSDIKACAKVAQSLGALLAVDSTAATPIHSNPITLGADIVMHSASKAINGHSDVLAGFLGVKDATISIWDDIKADRHDAGAILGSFDAWLLIRGMRTLPLRMERMSSSALSIARYLQQHPMVSLVRYPGLETDPYHSVACQQMQGGFGSLLSIHLSGGAEQALKVISKLHLFKRATSLGGVESLVEYRHAIEPNVPDDLLRISIGIEAPEDLINDLEQALQ